MESALLPGTCVRSFLWTKSCFVGVKVSSKIVFFMAAPPNLLPQCFWTTAVVWWLWFVWMSSIKYQITQDYRILMGLAHTIGSVYRSHNSELSRTNIFLIFGRNSTVVRITKESGMNMNDMRRNEKGIFLNTWWWLWKLELCRMLFIRFLTTSRIDVKVY